MKTCEEYYDLLVFFDDLSHSEQQEVKQHTEKCSACRKHLMEFQAIKASLSQREDSAHIDDDLLTRYGIYLSAPDEPDYDGRRLTRQEIAAIEKHVNLCRPCRQKANQITQEYREIEAYLEQEGVPSLHLGRASLWSAVKGKTLNLFEDAASLVKGFTSLPKLRLYPLAATALAGIVILLWASPLFRDSEHAYNQLASLNLDKEKHGFLTRNEASQAMSDGLFAFDHGRFDEAVEKFEQFIAQNPGHPSLFYAQYVAGLACLAQAPRDIFGRFQKYDANLVDRGIQHLQAAVAASDDLRIKEDAYWFIGKAHLMKQQAQAAKAAFEKVQEMKGTRFQDAQKMIAAIAEIVVP
jgi:tetratricopeptide (TPR) repeat protein